MKFENQTFQDETVMLDGNEFVNCTFIRCVIQLDGTADHAQTNSTFQFCDWALVGPANRTFEFLKSLYAAGGGATAFVEKVLREIQWGRPGQKTPTGH